MMMNLDYEEFGTAVADSIIKSVAPLRAELSALHARIDALEKQLANGREQSEQGHDDTLEQIESAGIDRCDVKRFYADRVTKMIFDAAHEAGCNYTQTNEFIKKYINSDNFETFIDAQIERELA